MEAKKLKKGPKSRSQRIENAEKSIGINKSVLADVLGKSPATISTWEQDDKNRPIIYWALKGLTNHYNYTNRVEFGFDE